MFRAALRPATFAARAARPAARAISSAAPRRAAHGEHDTHHDASAALAAPGAPAGVVPTDDIHATGVERLQLLGEINGVKVFDYDPLDSSRIGTMKDPVKVFSWDTERIIGCTGAPAESHELHWMTIFKDHKIRCPECGSVYEMDFQGNIEDLEYVKAHSHH